MLDTIRPVMRGQREPEALRADELEYGSADRDRLGHLRARSESQLHILEWTLPHGGTVSDTQSVRGAKLRHCPPR